MTLGNLQAFWGYADILVSRNPNEFTLLQLRKKTFEARQENACFNILELN